MRAKSRNEAWFDAPPEKIWRYIGDAHTYPDWVVGAAEARRVEGNFPDEGATLHHTQGLPKVGVKDTSSVVSVEPNHDLELEVRVRPFAVNGVRFILDSNGNDRTHVTMIEWPKSGFVNRLLGPLFAPAIQVRNAETLRRLKKLSEQ